MIPNIHIKVLSVLIVSLISLAISTTVYGQTKPDREIAGLFGPVRSVATKDLDSLGKVKKSGDSVSYNRSGDEISREMVSDYGEAMGRISATFSDSGVLTESVWTDPKGKVIQKDVYGYLNGRRANQLTYDGAGVLREKTVRSYDTDGRIEAETYWNPEKPIAKTTYKYGKASGPIEIAFFMADGRKATAPVGPCLGAHRIAYTYYANARISTKEIFENDGKLKKSYQYKYDDKGNFVEYAMRSNGGLTTTFVYKYEFDARGNWIKQTATSTSVVDPRFSFEKTEPYVRTEVTIREIVYY